MPSNKKKIALCLARSGMILMATKHRTIRKRSKWVKKWLLERESLSHVPLLREIKQNEPMDFKNYLRMDSATFSKLLSMVKNGLTKQHTAMREPISPEQRLTATLRFLATGRSYEDLKYSVGISAQALGYLIPETCTVIFEELKQEYLKFPTCKEDWKSIASGFESRWNFPNCAGALDGKHIRIVPPPRTGALYYNYKKFYSVILMALVKANCEFIYVDCLCGLVGKQGRMSDSAAFEWTSFYKKLLTGNLGFPDNSETKENLNFVIIGDSAFPLQNNLLKPSPDKDLTYERNIFNYRLSRARNVVENAFGLLAARFRIFHTSLAMDQKNIIKIVLAACTLHNFLIRSSPSYATAADKENLTTHITEKGEWRSKDVELVSLSKRKHVKPSIEAKNNRDKYCEYFNNKGKLDWQDKMIEAGKA
ncbi:LOW QUALITY PROTEIN: uncharacterized protein LOC126741742 [Anthonomus grandis grandis]|uniref:LOW QUALITY PROTEIN: uncharacterized protein LOC126741742 n=1 Tax=Anthonomus grandis grandis TaxID=2921223 RepID=UPI0021651CBE|nr:LOW QUALITY PROTEIN: uncharacterized protein LOC126741742 [Anthonomus grandis grandis]